MEYAPDSYKGLQPETLAAEEKIVLKAIDSTKEAIAEIDFETINHILNDIYKKVSPGKSDEERGEVFFPNERYLIQTVYSTMDDVPAYGDVPTYHSAMEQSDGKIKVFAREFVGVDGTLSKLQKYILIRSLIHEILHVKTEAFSESKDGEKYAHNGISSISESGYKSLEEGVAITVPFIFLNEALTETLTDAVFSEYLARTGSLKDFTQGGKWYQIPSLATRGAAYLPARLALMQLVDKISSHTGLPAGSVYQAFVVEYFTTGDLSRSEIFSELKDVPEIRELILSLKANDPKVLTYSEEEEQKIFEVLETKELHHVTSLVGRDYVGEVNKRKILRKKWYQFSD